MVLYTDVNNNLWVDSTKAPIQDLVRKADYRGSKISVLTFDNRLLNFSENNPDLNNLDFILQLDNIDNNSDAIDFQLCWGGLLCCLYDNGLVRFWDMCVKDPMKRELFYDVNQPIKYIYKCALGVVLITVDGSLYILDIVFGKIQTVSCLNSDDTGIAVKKYCREGYTEIILTTDGSVYIKGGHGCLGIPYQPPSTDYVLIPNFKNIIDIELYQCLPRYAMIILALEENGNLLFCGKSRGPRILFNLSPNIKVDGAKYYEITSLEASSFVDFSTAIKFKTLSSDRLRTEPLILDSNCNMWKWDSSCKLYKVYSESNILNLSGVAILSSVGMRQIKSATKC